MHYDLPEYITSYLQFQYDVQHISTENILEIAQNISNSTYVLCDPGLVMIANEITYASRIRPSNISFYTDLLLNLIENYTFSAQFKTILFTSIFKNKACSLLNHLMKNKVYKFDKIHEEAMKPGNEIFLYAFMDEFGLPRLDKTPPELEILNEQFGSIKELQNSLDRINVELQNLKRKAELEINDNKYNHTKKDPQQTLYKNLYKEMERKIEKFNDIIKFRNKFPNASHDLVEYGVIPTSTDYLIKIDDLDKYCTRFGKKIVEISPLETKIHSHLPTPCLWIEFAAFHGARKCFESFLNEFLKDIKKIGLKKETDILLNKRYQLTREHKDHLIWYAAAGENFEIFMKCTEFNEIDDECLRQSIVHHSTDIFNYIFENKPELKTSTQFCLAHHNIHAAIHMIDMDVDANFNEITKLALDLGYVEFVIYLLDTGRDIELGILISKCIEMHATDLFSYINGKFPDSIFFFDESGLAPIHLSIKYNNSDLFDYLLEIGADINQKNGFGETPLVMACKMLNSDIEMVSYLIKKGADVNIPDRFANTPLHYAVLRDHVQIAQMLIENGADVNQPNTNFQTPRGQTDMISREMKEVLNRAFAKQESVLGQKFNENVEN
ncbi:hypothetical protein TVAG_283760 [Trichomonas vaginalis G3]|uniref:DUF3447 domain-containing protein n=1 Tax=Trichomonas vaginalis (strain ATCC PRA-98 / G3) TaxID=412133 RepID=A2DET0_TRIV3|nr:spectrin binding [Trichomonas vaginalis G3]EAY21207.1 hypothetical protein TVAG_283760 [Trichomonas vaginalis G3]KAI5522264.1 spectrin binding [Trichomonas vaginalis G3]|eukprot:XP_001582193.1 hypothetical protein [Trichomonas vaginalis G3]